MRAITHTMNMQNTAPSQGDDVAASHIPCPAEPKIVPIGFIVQERDGVGAEACTGTIRATAPAGV
ncbi:hypothetical protein [Pseudarthrobacter sp. S9]|uniref:hypothetical protein n=1 Tax=Pseudarthrobacter sp. S9 TaxID=3418421 RepID=UPI003D05D613